MCIRDRARAFYEKEGDKYLDCDEKTRHDALARFGLDNNIPKMQRDLARYGIQYDQWFFESSLHESGYVANTVAALTELGVCPAGEDVHVQLRGGELIIRVLPGKKLLMTGSAVTVYEGVTEV